MGERQLPYDVLSFGAAVKASQKKDISGRKRVLGSGSGPCKPASLSGSRILGSSGFLGRFAPLPGVGSWRCGFCDLAQKGSDVVA